MSLESRDIHININTGSLARFFLVAVFLIALYYISDVLLVLIAAIVIASAIEPLVRRLKHYKIHRVIAVVIIYLFAAVVLASILIFFVPMVVNDAVSFLSNIPRTVSLGDIWSPLGNIGSALESDLQSSHSISVSQFVSNIQSALVGTGAGVFNTASFVFGGFLSFVLIVVLSFYLAAQEEGVDDFLRIVTPVKKHDYIIDLWKRSQRKIGYWSDHRGCAGCPYCFFCRWFWQSSLVGWSVYHHSPI